MFSRFLPIVGFLLLYPYSIVAKRRSFQERELKKVKVVKVPPANVKQLKKEDAEVKEAHPNGGIPHRVAQQMDVSGNHLENEGVVETLEDGSHVWRLQICSEGATFLSVLLKNLKLGNGDELYFYSVDSHAVVAGPFTNAERKGLKLVESGIIPGECVNIEVDLAPGSDIKEKPFLIEKVSYGYKEPHGISSRHRRLGNRELADQSCLVNVACGSNDGYAFIDNWRDEINSVAETYDGSYICTGQMITTDDQDCTKHYFLTAKHCTSSKRAAQAMTFYWNYECSTCAGTGSCDAPVSRTSSGSTILVMSGPSDATLLELNSAPDPAFNVYYGGFDARPTPNLDGGVVIHHPADLPKKINLELNEIVDGVNGGGWGPDHWRVNQFEIGQTLQGSSGSALWSMDHKIIGQLHGGAGLDCSNIKWEEHGKLSVSWENGIGQYLGGTDRVADGHYCSATPPVTSAPVTPAPVPATDSPVTPAPVPPTDSPVTPAPVPPTAVACGGWNADCSEQGSCCISPYTCKQQGSNFRCRD